MKKNSSWFRWIVWVLVFVMGINSIGIPVQASESETQLYSEELPDAGEEVFLDGENSFSSGEEVFPENGINMDQGNLEEPVPGEEIFSSGEEVSEEAPLPEEELLITEEESAQPGDAEEQSQPESESELFQSEPELFQSEPELMAEAPVEQQNYDINFYVIYEKSKLKLQWNGISGIKTWNEGRTTYHGVSVEDLMSVYGEFGFTKDSNGQEPDANKKFVSANRGKSGIEYGSVYTDPESGKTYVSYNYGADKQGVPVDVYYLPKGNLANPLLGSNVKRENSFYSVEVKGEGQDRIQYALYESPVETTVSNFNPDLPEQYDQIEWTCVGRDEWIIDGTLESGNQTKFSIGSIKQSYVIQRADTPAFDIQFYVYVDNEIRQLPVASLKKVYKWDNQGRYYLAVSDLAEIYKEYGMNGAQQQFGKYFPSAVRGEKTLAHGAMATYKGRQYVSYTQENQSSTVPTDVYYMPKGSDKAEKVPENVTDGSGNITSSVADQLKNNKNSFYSVTVIKPDGSQSVTYHKKDDNVTVSVDAGDTQSEDWLCVSEDENKTIQPVKNGQSLSFTIQSIEQPYTIACNKYAPETLNIKFYTFVDYQRFNVDQVEVPVLKDTTTKPGTIYYYISNEQLQKNLKKFHYDGAMTNGNRERFYYSKRDYDSLHNAGTYSVNGHDCIYIGKTGEPMDIYYLPDGEVLPLLNVKTLMEYHDNRYNGFYSVRVQDDNGQVYSPTELENLPAIDFVARKSTLTRTVSTKPRVEGQTGSVNWECRREDGTLSAVAGVKNDADQTMSFTIQSDDAVEPYVIVPDNTEKPAETKEANISFYVFIDGHYKLIKNINAEQHYITKANSGLASRYYLRAREGDTITQIYKEFGFHPDKLEPGPDGREKILFGYATDTRVFVQHPYKDKDGTWYIPVLKKGRDVSVYYFSQPNPLNPDKIENYFDRLTGLSAQIGVAGRHFNNEGSFHLIEVLDPMNLTKGQAILKQYVPHGEHYSVEVPRKVLLEGEYLGDDIWWSCTSDDKDAFDVPPIPSGDDKVKFEWGSLSASYKIVADEPQKQGTLRVIYDTTRYMKKLPKEERLTPQVGNKTRFTEDIPLTDPATAYYIRAPYPLTYDHEDNNSKELEQYEFDHWDYKDQNGRWQECNPGIDINIMNDIDKTKPVVFYAAWKRVSDFNRKQVQFYICKSAMPEDSSIELPSVKEDDFTSAVAVANCNVKATRLDDNVQIVGNKNPGTWEAYVKGHKRVLELLQGTKPDKGSIANENDIYKIDRIPSDEEVFQTIRESGRTIRIGEREIPPSKLDTEFFTIYWYSFNSRMSDGWHIDGRIVAKNGYLTVKKDFVGQPDVIEKIKKDYYISIDMDEKLPDGTVQPPAFHQHMKLLLPAEEGQTPAAEPPAAEAPIEIVGVWDDAEHTSCTWTVKADPFWKYTLKEHNYSPNDPAVKFSGWYNVHNSHEAGENVNNWELYPENSGIKFTGRGMGRGGEALTIELENRYQKPGILTLNKFDASTGQGMKKILFNVSLNGEKRDPVITDKNGIAEIEIPLQDAEGNNRTAEETYLLQETNVPLGYVDPGDIQITVKIADGAFRITEAKLVDRKAEGNQEGVIAPPDGAINGKQVLTIRGDTSLNIRNFSKTCRLHIKKTWETPNDALTEKQVKVRLYQNGKSSGQEFVLSGDNGWECTVDNIPLFLDELPIDYRIEEVEIGKTHYSPEFGDGFLYYEVIYPEILYKDAAGQTLTPTTEEEFTNVASIELGVHNIHFNLAERSFLKTDDLPRKRLEGAEFSLYEVLYIQEEKQYESDAPYTVEMEGEKAVLKKEGKKCDPFIVYRTDAKGMLSVPPDAVPNGRYWMIESCVPNKANKDQTQYKDNLSLYMMDVENEVIFLYERNTDTKEWKPLTDRHVVNHPQKGGVTVAITKEVTGPFGDRKKPFNVKVTYWEDGNSMSKKKEATVKNGDTIVLQNVKINSDIKITETVDTSKYNVSLSKKDAGTQKTEASYKGNVAEVRYTITGSPGETIDLTLTNHNIEDAAPDTGLHLDRNLYIGMLIIIIITAVLFFRNNRKSRRNRN